MGFMDAAVFVYSYEIDDSFSHSGIFSPMETGITFYLYDAWIYRCTDTAGCIKLVFYMDYAICSVTSGYF